MKDVSKRKVFGFAQADIEVPNELCDKGSEMTSLFVVQEICDCMKMHKETTSRKKQKKPKSYYVS